MNNIASSPIDAVQHYVWWAQLLVGLGLTALSAVLHVLEDRFDVDVLGWASWLTGVAGVIIILRVLF